ncbi:MAG: hypothetical protein AB1481_04095, partial [Candidatus Omnitrophota bacterium]
AETENYIIHRCNIAGREAGIFSEEALKLINIYSQGIPRKINNLCDLCLVIGMGDKAGMIDEGIVKKVVNDLKTSSEIMN